MFDGLDFPRLKEVILNNVENFMREGLRLSKYLQPTLKSLKLLDRSYEDEKNWLTASFLADVAERCPGLEEVSFVSHGRLWSPRTLRVSFEASGLAEYLSTSGNAGMKCLHMMCFLLCPMAAV